LLVTVLMFAGFIRAITPMANVQRAPRVTARP
jgi:hypothetical protein